MTTLMKWGCDDVEDKKGMPYYAFIFGVIVFILGVCWFLLREPDVSDQRDAARNVEQSLDRAGEEQRRAAESAGRIRDGLDGGIKIIERVEERADNAAGAINRAASGNAEARRIIEDSQRRVTECQGIISEIREGTR